MSSRIWPRLYVAACAGPSLAASRSRRRPAQVRRLLIAHHLLLGDTIMLTPLIKKARERFPDAEIVMTCPRPYAGIYASRPYGLVPLAFDAGSFRDHAALRRRRGFDLALVPGDNRWSWLARALDARWIVGFAPDKPGYRDWPVDELVSMPAEPSSWGDIATLLLEGDEPESYSTSEWRTPPFAPYEPPQSPYCVFHLGASSPHKLWPAQRWRALVDWAEARGYRVALSVGHGEEQLLSAVDPEGHRSRLAGRLALAQLWDLLQHAQFVVCPDTGVGHLARLVGTPSVVLYGPGSPISTGPGRFWAKSPFRAVWDPDVACRDQDRLFGRRVSWVRQCRRSVAECGNPVCIRRVAISHVIEAIEALISAGAKQHVPA